MMGRGESGLDCPGSAPRFRNAESSSSWSEEEAEARAEAADKQKDVFSSLPPAAAPPTALCLSCEDETSLAHFKFGSSHVSAKNGKV